MCHLNIFKVLMWARFLILVLQIHNTEQKSLYKPQSHRNGKIPQITVMENHWPAYYRRITNADADSDKQNEELIKTLMEELVIKSRLSDDSESSEKESDDMSSKHDKLEELVEVHVKQSKADDDVNGKIVRVPVNEKLNNRKEEAHETSQEIKTTAEKLMTTSTKFENEIGKEEASTASLENNQDLKLKTHSFVEKSEGFNTKAKLDETMSSTTEPLGTTTSVFDEEQTKKNHSLGHGSEQNKTQESKATFESLNSLKPILNEETSGALKVAKQDSSNTDILTDLKDFKDTQVNKTLLEITDVLKENKGTVVETNSEEETIENFKVSSPVLNEERTEVSQPTHQASINNDFVMNNRDLEDTQLPKPIMLPRYDDSAENKEDAHLADSAIVKFINFTFTADHTLTQQAEQLIKTKQNYKVLKVQLDELQVKAPEIKKIVKTNGASGKTEEASEGAKKKDLDTPLKLTNKEQSIENEASVENNEATTEHVSEELNSMVDKNNPEETTAAPYIVYPATTTEKTIESALEQNNLKYKKNDTQEDSTINLSQGILQVEDVMELPEIPEQNQETGSEEVLMDETTQTNKEDAPTKDDKMHSINAAWTEEQKILNITKLDNFDDKTETIGTVLEQVPTVLFTEEITESSLDNTNQNAAESSIKTDNIRYKLHTEGFNEQSLSMVEYVSKILEAIKPALEDYDRKISNSTKIEEETQQVESIAEKNKVEHYYNHTNKVHSVEETTTENYETSAAESSIINEEVGVTTLQTILEEDTLEVPLKTDGEEKPTINDDESEEAFLEEKKPVVVVENSYEEMENNAGYKMEKPTEGSIDEINIKNNAEAYFEKNYEVPQNAEKMHDFDTDIFEINTIDKGILNKMEDKDKITKTIIEAPTTEDSLNKNIINATESEELQDDVEIFSKETPQSNTKIINLSDDKVSAENISEEAEVMKDKMEIAEITNDKLGMVLEDKSTEKFPEETNTVKEKMDMVLKEIYKPFIGAEFLEEPTIKIQEAASDSIETLSNSEEKQEDYLGNNKNPILSNTVEKEHEESVEEFIDTANEVTDDGNKLIEILTSVAQQLNASSIEKKNQINIHINANQNTKTAEELYKPIKENTPIADAVTGSSSKTDNKNIEDKLEDSSDHKKNQINIHTKDMNVETVEKLNEETKVGTSAEFPSTGNKNNKIPTSFEDKLKVSNIDNQNGIITNAEDTKNTKNVEESNENMIENLAETYTENKYTETTLSLEEEEDSGDSTDNKKAEISVNSEDKNTTSEEQLNEKTKEIISTKLPSAVNESNEISTSLEDTLDESSIDIDNDISSTSEENNDINNVEESSEQMIEVSVELLEPQAVSENLTAENNETEKATSLEKEDQNSAEKANSKINNNVADKTNRKEDKHEESEKESTIENALNSSENKEPVKAEEHKQTVDSTNKKTKVDNMPTTFNWNNIIEKVTKSPPLPTNDATINHDHVQNNVKPENLLIKTIKANVANVDNDQHPKQPLNDNYDKKIKRTKITKLNEDVTASVTCITTFELHSLTDAEKNTRLTIKTIDNNAKLTADAANVFANAVVDANDDSFKQQQQRDDELSAEHKLVTWQTYTDNNKFKGYQTTELTGKKQQNLVSIANDDNHDDTHYEANDDDAENEAYVDDDDDDANDVDAKDDDDFVYDDDDVAHDDAKSFDELNDEQNANTNKNLEELNEITAEERSLLASEQVDTDIDRNEDKHKTNVNENIDGQVVIQEAQVDNDDGVVDSVTNDTHLSSSIKHYRFADNTYGNRKNQLDQMEQIEDTTQYMESPTTTTTTTPTTTSKTKSITSTTKNWWSNLRYAEISKFLNTIFYAAADDLYQEIARKAKEAKISVGANTEEELQKAKVAWKESNEWSFV